MPEQVWKEQDPGLFHELYGAYFDCVGELLRKATEDGLTRAEIRSIEFSRAFAESAETIEERLLKEALLCENYDPASMHRVQERCTAVVELTDERSALDRAMQEFAWMEKQTVRLPGQNIYRFTLCYDPDDEQALAIRLLGFGTMVRVLAPQRLADEVHHRIQRQLNLTFGQEQQ